MCYTLLEEAHTMQEEWKDIKGYEGIYQVSNFGQVKNINTGKILKYGMCKGYGLVKLYKNGQKTTQRVHRLVAEAFLPQSPNLDQVNHIDGCRSNNHISNLEWTNNALNQKHSFDVLKRKPTWKGRPLPEETKRKISEYWLTHGGQGSKPVVCIETNIQYSSACVAARELGLDRTCIGKCCRGKHKAHGGYHWRFA